MPTYNGSPNTTPLTNPSLHNAMPHDSHANTPRFRLHFFAPRFWGTWLKLLLLRLCLYVPRRWVMVAGAFVGDRVRMHSAKRRRIAKINLALCFPALSDAERNAMLVEHFRHYGRGLLDMALSLWGSRSHFARICDFDRREWLQNLARQHPVIVVTYHTTALDICGGLIAQTYPSVSMMKRVHNPLLNWQLWHGRMHHDRNAKLIMRDDGLRALVRHIKAGRVCIFVPDEDFGDAKHSVFAPFFGVQTATLNVVARLAKLTGARVVPGAARLDARSGRYVMTLGEPLENFPAGDAQADAATLNARMEKLIRDAPAQYLWTFRWFKTRPRGAANPYPSP